MSKTAESMQHAPRCDCGQCCVTCSRARCELNLMGECAACAGEPIDERELYELIQD